MTVSVTCKCPAIWKFGRVVTAWLEMRYDQLKKQETRFLIHSNANCVVNLEVCRFWQAFARRSAVSSTIRNTSAGSNSSIDKNGSEPGLRSTTAKLETQRFPTGISHNGTDWTKDTAKSIKQFQPLRFAVGLCCTSSGVALILGVGLRVVEMHDISNEFAMPLVAVCILTGVMLLGGGFGLMATSSSGFDEAEFDRLATAGNISAVDQSGHSDASTAQSQDAQQSAA